jgi:hypothetical protein
MMRQATADAWCAATSRPAGNGLENLDLSRIGRIEEISIGSALEEAALAFIRDA